jgi:hypothetical protein
LAGRALRRDVASQRRARASASAPCTAWDPTNRGRRVPRHPRPDVPSSQPRACRLAAAPYTRRAPGGPPVRPARRRTCVGRDAAVPRRHLRRQHAVTVQRLFKVASRPCACHAEPPHPCRAAAMDTVAAEH